MFSVVKNPILNLFFKGMWIVLRLFEVIRGLYEFLAYMVNSMLDKFEKY